MMKSSTSVVAEFKVAERVIAAGKRGEKGESRIVSQNHPRFFGTAYSLSSPGSSILLSGVFFNLALLLRGEASPSLPLLVLDLDLPSDGGSVFSSEFSNAAGCLAEGDVNSGVNMSLSATPEEATTFDDDERRLPAVEPSPRLPPASFALESLLPAAGLSSASIIEVGWAFI